MTQERAARPETSLGESRVYDVAFSEGYVNDSLLDQIAKIHYQTQEPYLEASGFTPWSRDQLAGVLVRYGNAIIISCEGSPEPFDFFRMYGTPQVHGGESFIKLGTFGFSQEVTLARKRAALLVASRKQIVVSHPKTTLWFEIGVNGAAAAAEKLAIEQGYTFCADVRLAAELLTGSGVDVVDCFLDEQTVYHRTPSKNLLQKIMFKRSE